MITKTRISLINTAAFLALGIAASSFLAPRAAAQVKTPQDVHVINAAADPLPVRIDANNNSVKIDPITNVVKIDGTTNTVKSTQSGNWNVGFVGTPSVTLSGTSTVQIGNPTNNPALFRDVDRHTAQPVRANLSATFAPNFAASTVGNTYTVPGGKRLVVEFVTVNITIPIGQAAQFARLDSTGFNQYLASTPSGSDATNKPVFIGTHRIFAMYDAGTIIEAFGTRNSGTGPGTLTMTISGYLVDI